MGRQGQPCAPAALSCGKSGQAGQAADPRAAVKVAGENRRYRCGPFSAQGKHHQLTQSAGWCTDVSCMTVFTVFRWSSAIYEHKCFYSILLATFRMGIVQEFSAVLTELLHVEA